MTYPPVSKDPQLSALKFEHKRVCRNKIHNHLHCSSFYQGNRVSPWRVPSAPLRAKCRGHRKSTLSRTCVVHECCMLFWNAASPLKRQRRQTISLRVHCRLLCLCCCSLVVCGRIRGPVQNTISLRWRTRFTVLPPTQPVCTRKPRSPRDPSLLQGIVAVSEFSGLRSAGAVARRRPKVQQSR